MPIIFVFSDNLEMLERLKDDARRLRDLGIISGEILSKQKSGDSVRESVQGIMSGKFCPEILSGDDVRGFCPR